MAALPYSPTARAALGDVAARWPLPDVDQIMRIAEGFARAIDADVLSEDQLFLAEREYQRLTQTTRKANRRMGS